MTTKVWDYGEVSPTGIIKSGGTIRVKKAIHTYVFDGCTLPECKCFKGPWVSFNFGYDKKRKTVSGITCRFDTPTEFDKFLLLFNELVNF
jgi:hypothetical protein